MATLDGLDEFGIVLFEDLEIPLGFPVPDAVRGEDQIHFLESALVRLRIQSPDHRNRDNVGRCEDVVGFLLDSLEHDRAEKGEPAVADRPTNNTPCITLGTNFQWENLGRVQPWTVSHVAPKVAVNKKIIAIAPELYALAIAEPSGWD